MALAYRNTFKPLFDRLCAAVAVVAFCPVLAGLWVLLWWRYGGTPLFRQQRIGLGGYPFWITKFRTLAPPGKGPTGLGRFLRETCLDELPQLFNILKGEMSFVGPRPLSLADVFRFSQSLEDFGRRHGEKPGMTGLAQLARGWGPADLAEMRHRLEWDLRYSATFGEDVRALGRTPLWVWKRIRQYLGSGSVAPVFSPRVVTP